jgi:ParB family chromosome partitioning protein
MTAEAVTQETTALPVSEWIPIDDLVPHVKNVRRHLGDLTELSASIKQQGILQPLVVAPHPSLAYKYVIIAGHRRHAAAKKARQLAVPCVVRRDLTSDVDVIVAMLTENGHRADLTPIEEAVAYEQLTLAGLKPGEIAKRVSRSRDTVDRRRHLLELPESTRERVQARQITLDQAEALAEFADNLALVEQLEHTLDQDGETEFRYLIARAREAKAEQAARAKTIEKLRRAGYTVVDHIDAHRTTQALFGVHGQAYQDGKIVPGGVCAAAVARHMESGCPASKLVASVSPAGLITLGCDHSFHRPVKDDDEDVEPDDEDGLDIGDGPATARAAERRRQEEAEREQAEADHRAAASLRRDYVRDLVNGTIPLTADMVDAITGVLAVRSTTIELEPDLELLARLLGRGDVADAYAEAEDARDWNTQTKLEHEIQDELRKIPGPRALLAVLAAGAEDDSARLWKWDPGHLADETPGSFRSWLHLLGGPLGYEWCSVEEAAIDAADQLAANRQAEAEQPADATP